MATFNIGIVITAVNRAGRELGQINRHLNDLDKAARKSQTNLRALHVVLAGLAVGGVANLAKSFGQMGAEMESLRIRLAVFEGGVDGADKRMKSLMENFGSLPFDFAEVTKAFQRLKAAGIEDTERALTSMMDALSAFGGGTDELQRLSIGIQQVAGKGVLSMEELRQQIGEAVPFAMRILAEETGRSVAQLVADVSKGAVDAQEAIDGLVNGFEKKFGGLSKILSRTMEGSFAGIRTAIKQLADKIFNELGLAPRFTIVFEEISRKIKEFTASLTPEDIEKLWTMLSNFASAAEGAATALLNLTTIALKFASAIAGILGPMGTEMVTYGVVGYMLFGVKGAALFLAGGAIFKLIAGLESSIKGLPVAVQQGLNSIGVIGGAGLLGFMMFGPAAGAIIAGVTAIVEYALVAIRTIGNGIARVFNLPEMKAGIEKWLGTPGESPLKALFSEMISNIENGDGAAAAAFQKGTAEHEDLIAQRAAALKRKFMEENKFDITTTAISAIEKVTALTQNAREKLEGATTLPFMQQIADMQTGLDEFNRQIDAEEKRLGKFLGGAKNSAHAAELKERAQGAIRDIAAMREQAGEAAGAIETLKFALAEAFSQELREKVQDTANKLNKFTQELTGTELDHELAQITERFDDIKEKLGDQLDLAIRTNEITGQEGDLIAQINALLKQNEATRAAAVQHAKNLYAIQKEIFLLESEAARNARNDQLTDMKREHGPIQLGDFSDYTTKLQDAQRMFRDELSQTAIEIEKVHADLENTNDPWKREELEKTLIDLELYQTQVAEIARTTTAEGMLIKDTWLGIGNAVKGTLVDALADLTSRTSTWQEKLVGLYDAITRAAAEYLVQLMLIKAAGAGMGGGAGGGLGALFGLGANANGNAFRGGIKAFANGGIIQGPTLFGLAGEKGDEAIMPLERIGGKLGVNAAGMGGGETHIHIHAIDTQSGMEFIRKNADGIVAQLEHKRRLNRGLDRSK